MARQSSVLPPSLPPTFHTARTHANTHTHTYEQRDYASARLEYMAALELDPDNTIVKDNLKKLERATAKLTRL